MYEIVNIEDGDLDRFIEIKNDVGEIFRIFDYSASVVIDIEDSFQVEKDKKYDMKLELFGDLIDVYENKFIGKKIAFRIIQNELIGHVEFYKILSEIGEFYIRSDQHIKKMVNDGISNGYYNYTRIDLIQLNDKVHPEII